VSAAREALDKLLARESALDADERRLLRGALAAYVDVLLESGDAARALEELKARCGEPPPAAPRTLGARPLRGMTQLDFEPYETRDYISEVCALLGILVIEDGDLALRPWLMQTLKIGFPGDRETALQMASALPIALAEARAAARDFYESLAAQPRPEMGGPGDHVSSLLGGLASPIWREALLREGAGLPDAELERLGADFALSFFDATRGWRQCAELAISDEEIEKLLEAGGPPARRSFALAAARLKGRVTARSAAALVRIVSESARAPEPAPYPLLAAAAECLEKSSTLEAAALPALEGALEALAGRDGGYAQQGAVEALGTLIRGVRTRSAPLIERSHLDSRLTVWRTPAFLQEPRLSPSGEGEAFYRRIRVRANDREWMTDHDEFGAFAVDAAARSAEAVPLPVSFRMRESGAAGFGRRLQVLGTLERRGEILVCVFSPFSRAKGWGSENLLFSWSRAKRAWTYWGPKREGGPAESEALAPGRSVSEEELTPACRGELVVKPDGTLLEDVTPHHLDSYVGPDLLNPLPGLAGAELTPLARPEAVAPLPAPAETLLAAQGLESAEAFAESSGRILATGSASATEHWLALADRAA
jgi:hypothetical protein